MNAIGGTRNIFSKFSNYRMKKDSSNNSKSNKSSENILNDSGNLK